jgi:hypothetical protein
MAFIINIQATVTIKDSRKVHIFIGSFRVITLSKTIPKIAKAAIKTTKGIKKASTALKTIEGPFVLPNCS